MNREITFKSILGGLIMFARESRGVSRRELSTALDISQQNLWDIENGYKNVTCVYFEKVLKELNMTPLECMSLVPAYVESLKEKASALEEEGKE